MKSISIGVFASILALVSALPLEKKDVVVVTVVENVVKTVDATVIVTAGQPSSTPDQPPAVDHHQADHQDAPQYGPKPGDAATSTTSTSSTPPPPPPTPTPASTPAPSPPPPTTPTDAAPSPPPPSPAPVQQAPAPAPVAPAPAPASSSSSASGGSCGEIGGACSGDITFYDTTAGLTPEQFKVSGFGACGWLNNGTSEDVFALAHGMMGGQSNGNPYCGRMATITLNGKSASGKLVDKCGACKGQDIDLSDHLFAALGAEVPVGRYSNVEWHFTT